MPFFSISFFKNHKLFLEYSFNDSTVDKEELHIKTNIGLKNSMIFFKASGFTYVNNSSIFSFYSGYTSASARKFSNQKIDNLFS